MEKRTLLAIVISIGILLAWDLLFVQPKIPEKPPASGQEESDIAQKELTDNAIPTEIHRESDPGALDVQQETIIINTLLYKATFSTKGAQLISLKLNKYRENLEADAKPVEMILSPMPAISLKGGFSDRNHLYVPSAHGDVDVYNNTYELVFRAEIIKGVVFRRIYTIDPNSYIIGCRVVLTNNTDKNMSLGMSIDLENMYPIEKKGARYIFEGPVLLNSKHLEEFKLSKIKGPDSFRQFPGLIRWFGFEDKYFLKAIILTEPQETVLTIKRLDSNLVRFIYELPSPGIEPGEDLVQNLSLFVGPKELKTLKASGHDLDKALDFGFFDIIAKPLLISLNWINQHVKSYGWSIIILTIIVKIILYPLTLTSFRSMKEMQKAQPLMKEIQTKYKDDRPKMNQELMKLYKEHKINPMGGCLPLLLQIPILFALYKMVLSAIELRHTPFHIVGTWLPDLSAKDPYYITPILMGVSWFIQQKMTPTTGDPTQQKMMLFMPIIFTILFLNFPSGLVIYWLISNVLSIIQQAYINRAHP
ncbi:MAG: membrane protein insertase YidC [Deltaproteobacteria bacterium]|nr:membrane protein insertase YidC [Deltaproteobacteria bacterium]